MLSGPSLGAAGSSGSFESEAGIGRNHDRHQRENFRSASNDWTRAGFDLRGPGPQTIARRHVRIASSC